MAASSQFHASFAVLGCVLWCSWSSHNYLSFVGWLVFRLLPMRPTSAKVTAELPQVLSLRFGCAPLCTHTHVYTQAQTSRHTQKHKHTDIHKSTSTSTHTNIDIDLHPAENETLKIAEWTLNRWIDECRDGRTVRKKDKGKRWRAPARTSTRREHVTATATFESLWREHWVSSTLKLTTGTFSVIRPCMRPPLLFSSLPRGRNCGSVAVSVHKTIV